MALPLRCQEEFPDDPDIHDADPMLRRIPPLHIVPDDNSGGYRPISAAFANDKGNGPMSVYRDHFLISDSRKAVPQMANGN